MKVAVLTPNASSFVFVCQGLAPEGIECVRFDNALSLLAARRTTGFDLLMIDAALYRSAGPLVQAWRECNADMCWPTLVFGHFFDRDDLRRAFNAGVDDVLTGCVDADELRARVQRLLRRPQYQPGSHLQPLTIGGYRLCRSTQTVLVDGVPVRLTSREFATAWLLFSSAGALLSRQQIASSVWGLDASLVGRSMEQYMYRLRKKLGLDEGSSVELKTIYSRGYQLVVHDTRAAPHSFLDDTVPLAA